MPRYSTIHLSAKLSNRYSPPDLCEDYVNYRTFVNYKIRPILGRSVHGTPMSLLSTRLVPGRFARIERLLGCFVVVRLIGKVHSGRTVSGVVGRLDTRRMALGRLGRYEFRLWAPDSGDYVAKRPQAATTLDSRPGTCYEVQFAVRPATEFSGAAGRPKTP